MKFYILSLLLIIFTGISAELVFARVSNSSDHSQEGNGLENDFEFFGPTRINGKVGNGALSVGISQWGEITVLRYPSPSFWDQLDYKTKEGELSRKLSYFGASENQGGFILIYYNDVITSLRDLPLEKIKQYYKSEDSGILVTEYLVDDEMKVYVYDFVHPTDDLFIRKISVKTSRESDIYVIHYLNLAPTTIKVPKMPIEDWQDDTKNDFAAFITDGIVVQFVPLFHDRKAMRKEYEKIKEYSYDQLIRYSGSVTGVFLSFTFFGKGLNWNYVGFDERCGDGREPPLHRPQSAFSKIKSKNIFILDEGTNMNSTSHGDFSICSADAFSAALACSKGVCDDVFFILSAGRTLAESIGRIKKVEYARISDMEKDTDIFWRSITSRLESQKFFPLLSQSEKDLCKRALISLIQATDRETKATVASISTQPPYAEDWPRDGAYFNLYLNLAGFSELAEERNLFYEKVQSKVREGNIPAGTWRMNFYADGMVGGPFDFEIDQVGFVLWSWAVHTNFTKDKIAFLKKIYDAVKLSSYEVLINCKDERGLQCLAHEDDQIHPSITMTGSGTVYTGIRSAMTIARLMGDSPFYRELEERRRELEEAIFKNYVDPVSGFMFRPEGSHQGMMYTLFPADISMKDEWIENYGRSAIDVLYYNFFTKKFLLYEAKWILSIIVAAEKLKHKRFRTYQAFRAEAEKFLRILVEEVPTSTKHVGEVVRVFEENGRYRYENRVAIPHIWEATLTCITAIALRHPESLEHMGIDISSEGGKSIGCQCKTFSGLNALTILMFISLYIAARALCRNRREEDCANKDP